MWRPQLLRLSLQKPTPPRDSGFPFPMKRYRGSITDHFDGRCFYNPYDSEDPIKRPRRWEVLRWFANRDKGRWAEWTDSTPAPPPARQVPAQELQITFVGHSTVLIQLDGFNILCDPHWSNRASPFAAIGPRRHCAPGLRFEDLPPIDVVLQSHDHYDHFDVPTLRRLGSAWKPHFIVPLGVRDRLRSNRIAGAAEATELDWWQLVAVSPDLHITAVPARHFSGRTLWDRNMTLWCGYVIEGSFGAVYFAGDTAYGPHFAEIKRRVPSIRVALLPIGAFKPQWFMRAVHMSPEEALQAHRDLAVETSIGIHFGTFALADDGQMEPLEELKRALNSAREPKPQFCTLGLGEAKHFATELTTT
jgi:L-ascorbate metabolism protein UlaG (beta-lactamase superfamily)